MLLFIPLALLVVYTNVKFDPANLFQNGRYEEGIAQLLQTGKYVTGISNYNERLLQQKLITSMSSCPQTIVLGASRIMEIRNDSAAPGTFFNNGVSMCVLEDIGSLFELYAKKNCLPQKLYIGLDPWMLNQNNPENRWKFTYDKYYYSFLERIGMSQVNNFFKITIDPRFLELFSLSYFQESFRKARNGGIERKAYSPTSQKVNETLTKLTDGSVTYHLSYRNKSAEELTEYVKAYSETVISSAFTNYTEISAEKKEVLYKFISYLKKKNIEVEIILCPFHPYTYQYLLSKKKYAMLDDAEVAFRSIAKELNVPVHGSYNPVNCKLNESYFYDEMHGNEAAMQKIMSTR